MEWMPKCQGRHDWVMGAGHAPRSFCYTCKRCGWWGWFYHLFECNEVNTKINFYRFPVLRFFGSWVVGPRPPMPNMKRERYDGQG